MVIKLLSMIVGNVIFKKKVIMLELSKICLTRKLIRYLFMAYLLNCTILQQLKFLIGSPQMGSLKTHWCESGDQGPEHDNAICYEMMRILTTHKI